MPSKWRDRGLAQEKVTQDTGQEDDGRVAETVCVGTDFALADSEQQLSCPERNFLTYSK